MANYEESGDQKTPILRLRRRAPTELIRPRQQVKQPDGPWIAHPDLIDEEITAFRLGGTKTIAPGVTMKEYRDLWNANKELEVKKLKGTKIEDFHVTSVIDLERSVNMQRISGSFTDHEIASAIERHYVGAHQYGSPLPVHFRFDFDYNLEFLTGHIAI